MKVLHDTTIAFEKEELVAKYPDVGEGSGAEHHEVGFEAVLVSQL